MAQQKSPSSDFQSGITSTTLPGRNTPSQASTDCAQHSMTLPASRYSCEDGEGSYTAGETRNTKMIRCKAKPKHRHHEESRDKLAITAAVRNFPESRLHITLVSVDESSTIADQTLMESGQRTIRSSKGPIRENRVTTFEARSAIPKQRSEQHHSHKGTGDTTARYERELSLWTDTTHKQPATATAHQDESAIPPKRAGPHPNNAALPQDAMSAMITRRDIASTEHPDEAPDVSEEWSVDPEPDPKGLTCHPHIIPQQEISALIDMSTRFCRVTF